jgi:glycosyltransferase involved in cell wall biosynthesis
MLEHKHTIIHLESSLGWGGQELRIFNESRWFIERGHRVILIAPKNSKIYQQFDSQGWQCHHCSFQLLHSPWNLIFLLSRFLSLKPDAINAHSNIDSKIGLLAAKFAGVKNIIRSRHVSNPIRNSWHNRIIYKHLATHIVTTGNCISQEVLKLGLPSERVTSIATGIAIPTEKSSVQSLKEELSLKANSRLVGMVSVLRSWKGHSFLIQAFKGLLRDFPNLHLILAGDGPGREGLEKLVRELQIEHHVHFLGHRNDVFHIFHNLDIALLTSTKNEGIPQTLIQAMACHCPVIGTNVGGIPELLMNGELGTLISPQDSQAIQNAIQEILRNPKQFESRTKSAYSHVAVYYNIERMGNLMQLIYDG